MTSPVDGSVFFLKLFRMVQTIILDSLSQIISQYLQRNSIFHLKNGFVATLEN